MAEPIELRLVTSSSFPSGTGSYSYRGEYQIVVQNVAYAKNVVILGTTGSGAPFVGYTASYQESLPENRELWKLTVGNELLEFVGRYDVLGTTYWDNNAGENYKQPPVYDEFDATLGRMYQVAMGTAGFSDATHITVLAGVKNLAYAKQVGILFTVNGWASSGVAFGNFDHGLKSGNEVWKINAFVGGATNVEYAIFYRVNGQEFWDNNFWRNYKLSR